MGRLPAELTLRTQIVAAIGVGALVSGVVAAIAAPSPADGTPALHLAVETAATVIAGLVALVVHGRYVQSRQRSDLLLTAAVGVVAVANLAFGAVPAVLLGFEPEPFVAVGVAARGVAALLMAAAALMPPHELARRRSGPRRRIVGATLLVGYIAAIALCAGETTPVTGKAFAVPAVVVSEAVLTMLFAAAAAGFARRAARDRDELMAWLATGAVFAAFARLNYMISPAALTHSFAAGELLRLAGFLCLLAGAAAEIRRVQRELAAAAVDRERRRIARDLHDGTAQDVAFILQMGRHLAERDGSSAAIEHIVNAAEQALGHTRAAVANLAHTEDEPLAAALRRTVEEVGGREGVRAEVTGAADLRVPPATRTALCLLLREAVTNAIRHGGAQTVRVGIDDAPELTLRIEDDGCGFDPDRLRDASRQFGIAGMDERVAQLGGELRVRSRPGEGTQLLVVLP